MRLKNLSNRKSKRLTSHSYPDSLSFSAPAKSIRKTKSAEFFRDNDNDNNNYDNSNDNSNDDNSNDDNSNSNDNNSNDNSNIDNYDDNSNNDNNNCVKKTDCECLKNNQHYGHIVLDTQLPGPIEKIYNLLFESKIFTEFVTNHEITDGNYD